MLCLLDKQSERKREKEWTTDFESEGREFESLRARQHFQLVNALRRPR